MARRQDTPKSGSPKGIEGHATRQTSGRVTIRDVAEQAGVSLGTASNVLNRPHRVAPESLARVHAVIDRLAFVRSSAAHQMRGGNSRCFGAVVLDASNPFFAETIRGLEDALHEQGCAVVVCSTDGSPEREARYLRLLEEQRVTDPEEARWFVRETGADCLAVSIGNVHGVYANPPDLDWNRL